DVLLQEWRKGTAGDVTGFATALIKHRIIIARDAALDHFQAHQLAAQWLLLQLFQRAAAYEVARLLQLAPTIQTRFPHVYALRNLVSVKRQLGFEPQRVARAQAARQDAEFCAGCEHVIPYALAGALVRRDVDFEAVLAGVAGARDHHVRQPADRTEDERIRLHFAELGIRQLLQR